MEGRRRADGEREVRVRGAGRESVAGPFAQGAGARAVVGQEAGCGAGEVLAASRRLRRIGGASVFGCAGSALGDGEVAGLVQGAGEEVVALEGGVE